MEEEYHEIWNSLPEKIQKVLKKAVEESSADSADEFVREIFVGDCPKCRSSRTRDCEEIPEVDDPTVGLCLDCGYLWCTECERPLSKGIDCEHWSICKECDAERDEFDYCGIMPIECEKVMGENYIEDEEEVIDNNTCAWCEREIDENSEVLALGARVSHVLDIEEYEGMIIPIPLSHSNRVVSAIITKKNSEARRDGREVMFMLCSQKCAESLKTAFEKEKISLN